MYEILTYFRKTPGQECQMAAVSILRELKTESVEVGIKHRHNGSASHLR